MHKIKKSLMLGGITFFAVVIVLILYVISPHTYTTDIGPDYSDRYYELINKGPLTEAERNELLEEKKKVEAAAIDAYKSKYLNGKSE